MLMVIFGAGASYDAVPTRPLNEYRNIEQRLPLADELFNDREVFAERMRWFPKCLDIVPRLLKIASPNTVEAALEVLQTEARTDPERHCQLAAVRFYLQSIIWETEQRWQGTAWGMTNYRSLIDQIRQPYWGKPGERVCFVTFNYDTMLESALSYWGVRFGRLSDYTNREKFDVIKLHGSVNWVREIDNIESCVPDIYYDLMGQKKIGDEKAVANLLIAGAACLKISDRYRMIDRYTIGRTGNTAILPAIAIPVQSKDEFECPAEHLEALRSFVHSQVTKILIVGWRGSDMPFCRLLCQFLSGGVRIMVVGPGASETTENLQAAEIYGPFTTFDHGFTDFIKEPAAGNKFFR